MTEEKFKQLLENTQKETQKFSNQDHKISMWRLVFFLLLIFFISLSFFIPRIRLLFWIFATLMLIIFSVLVIIHRKISTYLIYYQIKEEVINEYLDRFSDRWHYFKNDGLEYEKMDPNNILSDLDIIGKESLYKYLCIAKTKDGKNKLIKRLSNQIIDKETLAKRQAAIFDIINNIDFSLDFQVALNKYEKSFETGSLSYVKSELQKKHKITICPLIINIMLSLLTISTLFLIKSNLTLGISLFGSGLLINFIYANIYAKLNKEDVQLMNELSILYNLYLPMIKSIQKAQFNDETLFQFQFRILEFDEKKYQKIKHFASFRAYQKNFIANLIVNGLFPFTTLGLRRFNRFINQNNELLLVIPDIISDFEELTSLAVIGQVKQNIVMPILSEKIKVDFESLMHPLIDEKKVVSNSFQTNTETTIITGSNMSGKTSFLRTIGINLILMQAGTVVTATKFSASYLKIFTSMRITDDISKGISSFYRELLRIKEAIDYAKTKQPMIALIDEVFRGTNANDRITGAISMIRFLQMRNVILLITTHDQQLCTIEDVKLNNYYFSEYYENDQIKFDYKIKKGICPTTNAIYLMKLAGIIK